MRSRGGRIVPPMRDASFLGPVLARLQRPCRTPLSRLRPSGLLFHSAVRLAGNSRAFRSRAAVVKPNTSVNMLMGAWGFTFEISVLAIVSVLGNESKCQSRSERRTSRHRPVSRAIEARSIGSSPSGRESVPAGLGRNARSQNKESAHAITGRPQKRQGCSVARRKDTQRSFLIESSLRRNRLKRVGSAARGVAQGEGPIRRQRSDPPARISARPRWESRARAWRLTIRGRSYPRSIGCRANNRTCEYPRPAEARAATSN